MTTTKNEQPAQLLGVLIRRCAEQIRGCGAVCDAMILDDEVMIRRYGPAFLVVADYSPGGVAHALPVGERAVAQAIASAINLAHEAAPRVIGEGDDAAPVYRPSVDEADRRQRYAVLGAQLAQLEGAGCDLDVCDVVHWREHSAMRLIFEHGEAGFEVDESLTGAGEDLATGDDPCALELDGGDGLGRSREDLPAPVEQADGEAVPPVSDLPRCPGCGAAALEHHEPGCPTPLANVADPVALAVDVRDALGTCEIGGVPGPLTCDRCGYRPGGDA